ncbi:hypothetical protein PFISCL1PPCAC_12168, partial [Pristionchus fissidentatus]
RYFISTRRDYIVAVEVGAHLILLSWRCTSRSPLSTAHTRQKRQSRVEQGRLTRAVIDEDRRRSSDALPILRQSLCRVGERVDESDKVSVLLEERQRDRVVLSYSMDDVLDDAR